MCKLKHIPIQLFLAMISKHSSFNRAVLRIKKELEVIVAGKVRTSH